MSPTCITPTAEYINQREGLQSTSPEHLWCGWYGAFGVVKEWAEMLVWFGGGEPWGGGVW